MNMLFPEHLVDINAQKIDQDRKFILKEKKFNSASLSRQLNTLGNWMIAKGESLHQQYSANKQASRVSFLQDEASIFKA